jgi:phage regulator Rha-like protein
MLSIKIKNLKINWNYKMKMSKTSKANSLFTKSKYYQLPLSCSETNYKTFYKSKSKSLLIYLKNKTKNTMESWGSSQW